MKNVVHILRTFGDEKQPYVKHLLEQMNNRSTNVNHIVVCDLIHENSEFVTVKNVGYNRHRNLSVTEMFQVGKVLYYDKDFNIVFKNTTIKRKIKFLAKWIQLLIIKTNIIHIHHIHVVTIELLKYLQSKNIKVIVSLRGRDLLVNTLNVNEKKALLAKLAYVQHVHVISKFMRDKAIRIGIKNAITVIYRGVNGNVQKLIQNKKIVLENTNTQIKLFAVGRLVWEKGHIYLLESVKRMTENNINVSLDIYGSGTFFEFLSFRIKQLGLEKIVSLKGHVPINELRTLYKNYDIAVQPSISEALSNGLLDIVAHDIPCVISNVGGMVEIIKHKTNGIIFDIKKPETLDFSILEALKLDAKVLRGYNKLLLNKFSITEEINMLEKMYFDNV